MAQELTTTSYAVLGLLSVRPWSTYELAEQMQRAIGQFWPRAESGLYEEPKKLVASGFARAKREQVGKRPRTRYTITAKGKRALAAWVATPSATDAGPVLEFEQLVKVFFSEHGDKNDLLCTLDSVLRWVEERGASTSDVPRGYLEGRGPYPERLPWLIVSGKLLYEFQQAIGRWAQWAIDVVEDWPDDIRSAEPDWATLEEMSRYASDLAALSAAHRAAGGTAP